MYVGLPVALYKECLEFVLYVDLYVLCMYICIAHLHLRVCVYTQYTCISIRILVQLLHTYIHAYMHTYIAIMSQGTQYTQTDKTDNDTKTDKADRHLNEETDNDRQDRQRHKDRQRQTGQTTTQRQTRQTAT